MAKITFLGTGGDAYTVGIQQKGAGGIVVQLGESQFHLDPGPGSLPALRKAGINPRKTVAILVSHGHLNHAGDVNALISAVSHGGIDAHGVLLAADSVINGTEEISPSLSMFHQESVERSISLVGVPRVGINDVNIKVCHATHDDPTAVGFQLAAGKEVISYTGDTGLSEEMVESHKGATALIANMPLPEEETSQHLMNPDDVVELANTVKPKVLILTHFGQQVIKADAKAVGRDISKRVKCKVIVADDNMKVDTLSYR